MARSASTYIWVVAGLSCPSHNAITVMSTPDWRRCIAVVWRLCRARHNRHTTAMHLLQSGNDIYVVKDWLRHADVNTTHAYVEIDMKMKRKALESCQPPKANTPPNSRPKWLKPGILEWLENVSKGAGIMWSSGTSPTAARP